ncbi:MAG: hypothetical protein LBG05_07235 [Treponema sp.]|jgi:hypothetical protein|nr:hypothetical protein [Treponema sp.]
MKIFIAALAAILMMNGCNSSAPDTEENSTVAEDTEIKVEMGEGLAAWSVMNENNGWKFSLVSQKLADLSKYSAVELNVKLYNENGEEIAAADCENGWAQFKLLSVDDGDWDTDEISVGYNLKTGTYTHSIASTETKGVPESLVVMLSPANEDDLATEADESTTGGAGFVGYIEVSAIKFTAKVGDVALGHIFGSAVQVVGNKITFVNATNQDGAAYYEFPSDWLPLTGKTITVSYTLVPPVEDDATVDATSKENGDNPGWNPHLDHQLIIQAANGDSQVNYASNAQQYLDLNDPVGNSTADPVKEPDAPLADGTFSGTVTIDGDTLEEAASEFELTRMRIVNNGGEWTEETSSRKHVREKSYTVIFNSITVGN